MANQTLITTYTGTCRCDVCDRDMIDDQWRFSVRIKGQDWTACKLCNSNGQFDKLIAEIVKMYQEGVIA